MNKQTLILILVSIVFIGAAVGAFFVYKNTQEKEVSTINKYSPASSTDEKMAKSKTEQVQGEQSSGLQVQGATTDGSQNQNSLPTPKQFSVYEKHAEEQTALYIDIVKGQGATAENGDTVAVVYKGWLTNGEIFDQSRKNEQGQTEPFVLQLGAGRVIPGWEQTLVGMKQGGKRRLVIPYTAGYGEAGQGPIPAKAMLIFDVELVEVQKQDLNPPGAILP